MTIRADLKRDILRRLTVDKRLPWGLKEGRHSLDRRSRDSITQVAWLGCDQIETILAGECDILRTCGDDSLSSKPRQGGGTDGGDNGIVLYVALCPVLYRLLAPGETLVAEGRCSNSCS